VIRRRYPPVSPSHENKAFAELARLCSAEVLDYVDTVAEPIKGEEPISLATLLEWLEKSQFVSEPQHRAKLDQLKGKYAQ